MLKAVTSALSIPQADWDRLAALTMPSTAHLWATFLVGLAITFAVGSSIWALLNGVTQARFMLAGYLAILIPGLIILPANLGMMDDIIDNADLLVLIGNALEAMLLAVALADRVKSVEASRETFRVGMQAALQQAARRPLEVLLDQPRAFLGRAGAQHCAGFDGKADQRPGLARFAFEQVLRAGLGRRIEVHHLTAGQAVLADSASESQYELGTHTAIGMGRLIGQ